MSEYTPPLVDQAFQRLRQDVLKGAFASGDKLKIEELQAAYAYSSSPMREALSRLSQQGLVSADERRGYRVAAPFAGRLASNPSGPSEITRPSTRFPLRSSNRTLVPAATAGCCADARAPA